jgi:hypothetical protein
VRLSGQDAGDAVMLIAQAHKNSHMAFVVDPPLATCCLEVSAELCDSQLGLGGCNTLASYQPFDLSEKACVQGMHGCKDTVHAAALLLCRSSQSYLPNGLFCKPLDGLRAENADFFLHTCSTPTL